MLIFIYLSLLNLSILYIYQYLWHVWKWASQISKKELGLCGVWLADTAVSFFRLCFIIQTDITFFSGSSPSKSTKAWPFLPHVGLVGVFALQLPIDLAETVRSASWSGISPWQILLFPFFFHRCYFLNKPFTFQTFILASVCWKTQHATIDDRSGPRKQQ